MLIIFKEKNGNKKKGSYGGLIGSKQKGNGEKEETEHEKDRRDEPAGGKNEKQDD